jgi:hypothetical protein
MNNPEEKRSETSSSSSSSEAHPTTSREFEEGKRPSTVPSVGHEESNVQVHPAIHPEIEKRRPGTARQLMITSFKVKYMADI